MKVSHNWLKELVNIDISPIELAEKLSIGGFEVESLEDLSLNVKNVVLGKVTSVEKHTNSDKLKVCMVDIGKPNNLQIICGANNIKSDVYVFVATVGAYLRHIDLKIKSSAIRGINSEGMICSLQELGLEEKSDGIKIIDDELAKNFNLGDQVANILNLNDFVYDLAITANRPDGMSVIGIAREISALLKTKLSLPDADNISDKILMNSSSICTEAVDNDCIYTVSFLDSVDGRVKSPQWIKERLERSDFKSINLIVDLTNYILLEQGQPLHAFDRDKLVKLIGREVTPSDFGVRKALDNEVIVGLDSIKYSLNPNVTIITCDNKPIAIAGVIGGIETSVTDTTRSICLEVAVFNPSLIRRSTKAIGIKTESSSRFEKGISYKNTLFSIDRSLKLFKNFFNIENFNIYISKEINETYDFITLRRDRINKILGKINDVKNSKKQTEKRFLNDSEIEEKLQLIGCILKNVDYGWEVIVLPNRSQDLQREIDLIEEIARLIGYDKFEEQIPYPLSPGILSRHQLAKKKLKNSFVNNGFYEVLTYSLVQMKDNKNNIKISNPLVSELSCLRESIWEEHYKICDQNIKSGQQSCWIFEFGNVFIKDNEKNIQIENISGIICGNKNLSKWDSSAKNNSLNYFEARGKLQQALSSLNVTVIDKVNNKYEHLHPGRSSTLFIEGKESGYFGEIHPKILLGNKSIKNLYLFCINSDNLLNAATRKNIWYSTFKNYPTVPSIERDVNFIFRKHFLVSDIKSFIKKNAPTLLEEVSLIDIYSDSSLSKDSVSYTFRLSYRDKLKTLEEKNIHEVHNTLVASIEDKFKCKQKI